MADEPEPEEADAVSLDEAVSAFRFLSPFFRSHRSSTGLIGGLLLIDTAFNTSFPLLQRWVIDEGLVGRDWSVIVWATSFLALAAVAVSALGVVLDWQLARVAAEITRDIRTRLFEHLHRVEFLHTQRKRSGALLSRFSGDTVAVENALVSLVPEVVLPGLEVIYSMALMFAFSPVMGGVSLLIFPLVLWGPNIFARRALTLSYLKRRKEARLVQAAHEAVAAQPVIRAFHLMGRTNSGFGRSGAKWLLIARHFNFAGALVERSAAMSIYLLHVVVFALGAWLVWKDVISVGTLIAFEATFLSMGEALIYLTQSVPNLAAASGAIKHIDEVLRTSTEEDDVAGRPAAPSLKAGIRFQDVQFTYSGRRFRLQDLNFEIPHGAKVAIVGHNGSGKSTVLALLLRFLDPQKGSILWDGRDMREFDRASLRAHMAVVFQDNFLFDTSIVENIRVGREAASDADVIAAARAAGIDDFIQALPAGYETRVGERGVNLSGGQRQRIALARAIIRNPAILLLDEPASALDPTGEASLGRTLGGLEGDRTVVVVTHRLSSITGADLILVMDHGRVVERGTHADLLAQGGAYARLWQSGSPRNDG